MELVVVLRWNDGSLSGWYILNLFGGNIGFGYIMIMATAQYPDVWVSNTTVLGVFLLGPMKEVMVVSYFLKNNEVEVLFKFNGLGN